MWSSSTPSAWEKQPVALELYIRSSFAVEEGHYWITHPWVEAQSPSLDDVKGSQKPLGNHRNNSVEDLLGSGPRRVLERQQSAESSIAALSGVSGSTAAMPDRLLAVDKSEGF